jgi:hypothetical protein
MVLRATRQHVEALYPGDGKLRLTRQHIEALLPVNPEAIVRHTLNFEETIYDIQVIEDFWPVTHSLNLQDGIRLKGYEWINSEISFSQVSVGTGSIKRTVHQGLYLKDVARSRNIYVTVEDIIELEQVVPTIFTVSVAHTINLSQSIPRKDYITDDLGLLQSILVGKSLGLPAQDLGLTETIAVSGVWGRTITDDININQTVTFYQIEPCTKKRYSPFIGESESTIEPPLAELPFVQDSEKQFRLEYPALGGVIDSVLLRSPELDNVDQVATTRINRETRGGELNIFADPIWPKVHTLKVTFIGLLTTEAESLQDFIINHLGENILLTDWEGREWIGVIVSPDEPIVQDGENRWSAYFTFEGELLDSCTPDSDLGISDSNSFRGDWHRKPSSTITLEGVIAFNVDWSRGIDDDVDLLETIEYEVV